MSDFVWGNNEQMFMEFEHWLELVVKCLFLRMFSTERSLRSFLNCQKL